MMINQLFSGKQTGILFCPQQLSHRIGGNQKRFSQSKNVDQKSLETVFLIVICRQPSRKLCF